MLSGGELVVIISAREVTGATNIGGESVVIVSGREVIGAMDSWAAPGTSSAAEMEVIAGAPSFRYEDGWTSHNIMNGLYSYQYNKFVDKQSR